MAKKNHSSVLRDCHNTLAASHIDLNKRHKHARSIELQALVMQKRLQRRLPELQQAADRAPQGSQAQRDYLTARKNLHRCEQAFQIARQQRLTAEQMLGSQAGSVS